MRGDAARVFSLTPKKYRRGHVYERGVSAHVRNLAKNRYSRGHGLRVCHLMLGI